jgi:hypothetical protein
LAKQAQSRICHLHPHVGAVHLMYFCTLFHGALLLWWHPRQRSAEGVGWPPLHPCTPRYLCTFNHFVRLGEVLQWQRLAAALGPHSAAGGVPKGG